MIIASLRVLLIKSSTLNLPHAKRTVGLGRNVAWHCADWYTNPCDTCLQFNYDICHDQHDDSLRMAWPAWRTPWSTEALRWKAPHRHNAIVSRTAADTQITALHRPRCPQRGPLPLLPSPLARLLHYLKHSLVFICRAGDVATSSTFPSPAVYIREPIWLYKTRQQKGGGPEPERRETWKPFYRAASRALR